MAYGMQTGLLTPMKVGLMCTVQIVGIELVAELILHGWKVCLLSIG